jgi:hypothetical protein
MGISLFNTWLFNTYSNCIKKTDNEKYDHIYIDFNFILYKLSYINVSNENDLFNKILNYLDNLIIQYFPFKTITIAIDGPPVYAKMQLQRSRRDNIEETIQSSNSCKFNTLNFTPGTIFMSNLENTLNKYISNLSKFFKYFKPKIEIISSTLKDEAEIKIINEILINHNLNNNNSHVIIGNDADIIVIAITLIKVKNISIILKHNSQNNVISIDKIIETLYLKYNYDENIRYDFAFLSILMGNDYLPKLKFVTFNKLWSAYNDTYNNYILYSNGKYASIIQYNNGTININNSFLSLFVHYLSTYISSQFKNINICKYNNYSVTSYLEGILWCINMYSTGTCSKYDYIYNCLNINNRYISIGKDAPNPLELLYFMNFNETLNITIPYSNIEPPNSKLYSIIVMPKNSINLIPTEYHQLFQKAMSFYNNESGKCKTCELLDSHIKKSNNKKNISKIAKLLSSHKHLHKNAIEIEYIFNCVKLIE